MRCDDASYHSHKSHPGLFRLLLPRHSVSVYVPLERSLGWSFDDIYVYMYVYRWMKYGYGFGYDTDGAVMHLFIDSFFHCSTTEG